MREGNLPSPEAKGEGLMSRKIRQRFWLRLALGWWVCRASRRVGSRTTWRRQI